MKRFSRNLLIAGIVLGTSLASVADLYAGCGGGGGGGYRHHYPTYRQPSHYQPSCHSQPRPVYQPAPVYTQPAPQPRPILQQPIQQQPIQQPAPQTQPAAPETTPVSQSQPSTAPTADAQMTALQALAQMTGQSQPQSPTTQTPAQPQGPGIAGTWTARLNNGAVVRLTLQANGTFNWSATNKTGQVSTFQGSYTTASGSLTLIRSDNRKLEGTMTQSGNNAFNFKLAGAKDNGLDFARS